MAGTRQRLSGFSQLRQCGDVVLRMFVTGYPPARERELGKQVSGIAGPGSVDWSFGRKRDLSL